MDRWNLDVTMRQWLILTFGARISVMLLPDRSETPSK